MDNPPTMPLKKTYPSPMHLSIMMIPSLMNPQAPLMFAPSSSPSISKENGITVSGKPPPLILSMIFVSKNPNHSSWIIVDGLLLKR